MSKKVLCISLSLALICTTAALAVPAAAEGNGVEKTTDTNTVTIYTTNDIHGVVGGSNTAIGLPQTAAIAASTENALLVDAGDAIQGASFATVSQGLDVVRLMNSAGYELMASGNHKFHYGYDMLMSNYIFDSTRDDTILLHILTTSDRKGERMTNRQKVMR